MGKIAAILAAVLICTAAAAGAPTLRFGKSGEFKVIQLTDLHLVGERPDQAEKTFARIRYIVEAERPDMIAVTGDVITGAKYSREMLRSVLDTLDSFRIPFCIVFGNHDQEMGMTKEEMSEMITSCKYSLNSLGADGKLADIRIPVRCSKGRDDAMEFYFLDSHTSIQADSPYAGKPIRYEWFDFDQVCWIRSQFAQSASEHGRVLPSAAFFHIPLPEFIEAWENTTAQHFTHNNVKGVRGEYGGHSRINSGMFAAMLEGGSTMGVFCGHDHDSDFIVEHMGIALAYGRFSGDDTVYHHLMHGTRVIVFKEGERSFRTWIHEDDGQISYSAEYSDGILR